MLAPLLVLMLLGVCYLDSHVVPNGILGSLLPDSISLIQRNAEAGISPDSGPEPLPEEIRESLDIGEAVVTGGKLVQKLDGDVGVHYTIDPDMQAGAKKILDNAELLSGSLVLVESKTGKILAMADTGTALTPDGEPQLADDPIPASLSAEAPAASVFKVVTSSALVETAGVNPDEKVCYFGGSQKLKLVNLEDDPNRDKSCATLGFALGMSINSVFAKLADRHLDADSLGQVAGDFGFGQEIPLDYPQSPAISSLDIPEDRLEFARTAAGFWHTHLTPLHAAFVAQAVAQDGAMLRPLIVDEVVDAEGQELWSSEPRWLRRTVSKETADAVGKMMINTTTKGTARKYFKDSKGNPFLPGILVAGKTGTLTRAKPYRGYTWFIGFAPADDPQVAVAALAVNTPKWKVKATALARDLLRKYFKKKAKEAKKAKAASEASPAKIVAPSPQP